MGKGRFAEARIVGVIGDTKQTNVIDATKPEIYFCLAQIEPGTPLYGVATAFIQVAIRAAVPADTLRAQFDKALHEVAPDATTDQCKDHSRSGRGLLRQPDVDRASSGGLCRTGADDRLGRISTACFPSRWRSARARSACASLWARRNANIFSLVLRRAMLLIGMGLAIGGVMAWFAVRLASTYIFGVQAHDAFTFTAASCCAGRGLAHRGLAARAPRRFC